MIKSYTFKKKIINNCDTYYLEIIFPDSFNDFTYKIYGDKGFIQHGKHNLYNNILKKNVLIIEIDKLQLIFISILFNDKNNELFDFINLHDLLNIKKNIKIDIQKINSVKCNIFNNLKVYESEEDDTEDEDKDSEETEDEDKDSEETEDEETEEPEETEETEEEVKNLDKEV